MRNLAFLSAILVLATIAAFLMLRPDSDPAQHTTEILDQPSIAIPDQELGSLLSILGEQPDWTELDRFQHTISRSDFEHALINIYTTDDTWRTYIEISETSANLRPSSDRTVPPFILQFSSPQLSKKPPIPWKLTADLSPAPTGKPLTDIHIAIDPGHIGGDWAKMEARWFKIGSGTPVTEGDMTLKVAQLMKPMLENLGAKVTLVREKPEPVTHLRPADMAGLSGRTGNSETEEAKFHEELFYRTAEIRARADLINDKIKPDLTLCLHFNAAAWGNPENPTLVPDSHFHILLNGGYTSDEVRLEDQRFAMIEKILLGTHREEILVGKTVAETFVAISDLPAYRYSESQGNVRSIPESPYLYARNLLANRLYNAPVIFMEPYVMNSEVDYARAQAGHYKGLKEVAGKLRPSIFQEYAIALASGLAKHYQRNR